MIQLWHLGYRYHEAGSRYIPHTVTEDFRMRSHFVRELCKHGGLVEN